MTALPPNLIVVRDPSDWPLDVPDTRVVGAKDYLTDPAYVDLPRTRVFNLCRAYRYQKAGYYVSLLAEARGHKPTPSVATIQELKSPAVIRVASGELEELIQKSLAPIQSDEFTLSVYFGRNVAKRHDELAAALFRQFSAPLLRAEFERNPKSSHWTMTGISLIGYVEVPVEHRPFLFEVTREYFACRHRTTRKRADTRFDLAILCDADAEDSPSDERALKKFQKAGEAVGFDVDFIEPDDFARLGEFEALFLRETTSVNHRTYRFAEKAKAQGLVVIDDPDSILKCSNKVFLAEMLLRNKVPHPKTMIVHRGNEERVLDTLGLPCILKQPDSAFSQGVKKADTREQLDALVDEWLERSDLIVAQEFVPTEFDWRIGVLDRQPLYACRYFMATRHWQIVKRDAASKEKTFGRAETLPIEHAPTRVVKAALKAANLIGDGLYGVDLKQIGDKVYVIEVNDNPNIDAGVEDAVLKDELYLRVMRVLMQRVEQRRRNRSFA